ncbi:hypothetical protein J6590_033882 [Homalodisca vitripennis]|nr:hypothetical protein J6590_033882 [Homalodisca vitripennis]
MGASYRMRVSTRRPHIVTFHYRHLITGTEEITLLALEWVPVRSETIDRNLRKAQSRKRVEILGLSSLPQPLVLPDNWQQQLVTLLITAVLLVNRCSNTAQLLLLHRYRRHLDNWQQQLVILLITSVLLINQCSNIAQLMLLHRYRGHPDNWQWQQVTLLITSVLLINRCSNTAQLLLLHRYRRPPDNWQQQLVTLLITSVLLINRCSNTAQFFFYVDIAGNVVCLTKAVIV